MEPSEERSWRDAKNLCGGLLAVVFHFAPLKSVLRSQAVKCAGEVYDIYRTAPTK
jgi:hypothetical protein